MTDNNGFISVVEIDSTSLVPFGDYVPVYIDNSATDVWMVEANGYIPVEHSGFNSLRRIPTFAGSQYGTIDTPITMVSGDEIEIEFANTTSDGASHFLIDLFGGGANRGYLSQSTTDKVTFDASHFTVTLDGVSVTSGTTAFPVDGKIHVFKCSIISGTHIDTIGANDVNGALFQGQILSVKFTDAGTVVANYVFDSGSDLYQLPRGEGLGSEKVINGTFDENIDDWLSHNSAVLSYDAGRLKVTSNGVLTGNAYQTIATVIGKSYVVKVDYIRDTQNGILAASTTQGDGGNLANISLTASGSYSLVFTATTTTTYIRIGAETSAAIDHIFDNVSTKQLPDLACLLTNFATTDWNRYTQQRNIAHDAGIIGEAWVGDNVVVNGTFDTDLSGWSVANPSAQTVEWVDGELHVDGDGISVYGASQSALIADNPMLIKVDYRHISGQQRIQHGGTTFTTVTTTKTYTIVNTPSSAFFGLYRQAAIAGEGYFDNASAKHLLEVA